MKHSLFPLELNFPDKDLTLHLSLQCCVVLYIGAPTKYEACENLTLQL